MFLSFRANPVLCFFYKHAAMRSAHRQKCVAGSSQRHHTDGTYGEEKYARNAIVLTYIYFRESVFNISFFSIQRNGRR